MRKSAKIKRFIPRPKRLEMPADYNVDGINYKPPMWEQISDKLRDAEYYWIGTKQPDNGLHTVPIWGIWLDDMFLFVTRRKSKKARNLCTDPNVVVHLESATYVVILQGIASEVKNAKLLKRFENAYLEKYDDEEPVLLDIKVVFALKPTGAYTWLAREYRATATRWQLTNRRRYK